MKRILLPTDFSMNAQHAIDYALMLWGDEDSDFILLNSYNLIHNTRETLISLEDILKDQSEKALSESLVQIRRDHQNLSIEALSTNGETAMVIEDMVIDRGIDMVVMGTQGSTALKEFFFGSNTTNLIRRISKPILAVPPQTSVRPPKKIVFATDLTQVEDLDILKPMTMLARKVQAEVIVINVSGKEYDAPVRDALQKLNFNNHFSQIKYRFELIKHKDIIRGIIDFLELENADMLVLLPKHYPDFKGLFHRSVTKRMISKTDVPVLIL